MRCTPPPAEGPELARLASLGEPELNRTYRGWSRDVAQMRRNREARVLAKHGYLWASERWDPNRWEREGHQDRFIIATCGKSGIAAVLFAWRELRRPGNRWMRGDMRSQAELAGTLTVVYRKVDEVPAGWKPPPVDGPIFERGTRRAMRFHAMMGSIVVLGLVLLFVLLLADRIGVTYVPALASRTLPGRPGQYDPSW